MHGAPVCHSLAGVSALGFLLRPKPVGMEQPRASAAPRGASLDVQRQPRRQQREATRCFLRVKVMAEPRNSVLSLSNETAAAAGCPLQILAGGGSHEARGKARRQKPRQARPNSRCSREASAVIKHKAVSKGTAAGPLFVQSCNRFVCSGQKLGLKHWKCSGRR